MDTTSTTSTNTTMKTTTTTQPTRSRARAARAVTRWLAPLALAAALVAGGAGCGGAQASCNQMPSGGGGSCQEYSGAPADALNTFMGFCGRLGGTWTNSACTRTGSIGECHTTQLTATVTEVHYSGSLDALRSSCATNNGTWSGP